MKTIVTYNFQNPSNDVLSTVVILNTHRNSVAVNTHVNRKVFNFKIVHCDIRDRNMNPTKIWTDGSCIYNGTPQAKSGIGIFYQANSNENVSSAMPTGKQTNNRAELCAILLALCTNPGHRPLIILTDSQYSIKCITEYADKWSRQEWKTSTGKSVEWVSIIKCILTLMSLRQLKGGYTKFEFTKGHSTDSGNIAADRLARTGATSGKISNTIMFLEQRCNIPFS